MALIASMLGACTWTTSTPTDAGLDASRALDVGMDAASDERLDAWARDAPALPDTLLDGGLDGAGLDGAGLDGAGLDGAGLDGASLDTWEPLDAPIPHLVDVNLDAPLGRPDAGDVGPIDAGITRTLETSSSPSATPIAPFSTCSVSTYVDAISGAEHRVPCDDIAYPFHPPSSGPHFSQWASFLSYDAPVPWGFLVHAMEHGAVVLAYHCELPSDCDAVRAEYASIVTDQPLDPLCRDEDWRARVIVVPDPALEVPIAAVAWGHVYEATCLDPASLRAFVTAHYDMATEHLCAAGVDLSPTGWCP
ncbi:MAG: DUF3105 domain-containing protein [Sandaracinus sp.]